MTTDHFDMTIDELLHDPLIRTMMRADGVDVDALRHDLLSLARRLARSAPRRSPISARLADAVARSAWRSATPGALCA
jgi:hypothetical protein